MSTLNVADFDFTPEFNEILGRISQFSPEISKGDSDIARALDVSRTTPSTWRKRGKLPLEAIVKYATNKKIDIHWLLTGEHDKSELQMSTQEESDYMTDLEIIKESESEPLLNRRVIKLQESINESTSKLECMLETLTVTNDHQDYELVKKILSQLSTQINCDGSKLQYLVDYINQKCGQNITNEFAMIPGYNIQVSAGHGAINGEEQPTRYLAFRHKWLKYRGFNENNLVVVFAKGDSMEPTITNNNSLLIHTKIESILDGGIYVIRQDDTLLVKRVQRLLDGNLKLISDNTAYEPMVLTKDSFESLDVIGQVVWIAKDIG